MNGEQIAAVVEPILGQFALELDAVEIRPAGRRSLVRVVVDGDGPHGTGPSLDDLAEATKAVSAALDTAEVTGAGPYTLEVTSRGVGRPLVLPRHWRRNHDRLVRVTLTDEETVTGRILRSDEEAVLLDVDGTERRIDYDTVSAAFVQIELNRRPRPAAQPAKEN